MMISKLNRRKKMARRDRDNGGNMSVRDAGRKGGRTTANKYGREFYQEIGQKGGRNSHRGSMRDEM
jgi:general stress protein YciG